MFAWMGRTSLGGGKKGFGFRLRLVAVRVPPSLDLSTGVFQLAGSIAGHANAFSGPIERREIPAAIAERRHARELRSEENNLPGVVAPQQQGNQGARGAI